ncbi:sialidase family protein [Sandaracinus amylolyticus]|uniref:sialidase family protein n=1 Tax=Sandaracinus amylolyticus TaxID=927083 RepID=UPI001F3AB142|nr:sialidase family protein [Sandaracinus amylolyticus]
MQRTSTRAMVVSVASILTWSLIALACEGELGGSGPQLDPRRDARVDLDVDAGTSIGIEDGGEAPLPSDGGTMSRDDGGTTPQVDAGTTPVVDAGTGGGDEVSIFVAQGYVGRTTISCDDGRTWIENRSMDDSLRCFQGIDCDHHPGRAKGIVYTRGGTFVATYGWGPAGGVERSRDGVNWERTLEGTTFGGIATEGEHVLLGAHDVRVSEDDGETWSAPITSRLEGWNVRRAGASSAGGGRLLLVGDGGDVTLSSDDGRTWWRPSSIPGSCGASIQNDGGIGTIGDTMVIVGGNGDVCHSRDGGTTWTGGSLGTSVGSSDVVSTGSELMVWGGGRVFRSRDGATWTSTPLSPAGITIGAVTRGANGTFVAVNGGWDQWYDRQRFYRSTDGVSWTELPQNAYVRSHPILQIREGRVPRSTCE